MSYEAVYLYEDSIHRVPLKDTRDTSWGPRRHECWMLSHFVGDCPGPGEVGSEGS